MIRNDGGWLFLSHSEKDVALVRDVRNRLENHGFQPITFFLKCLTDNDELDVLIRREIEARKWFLLIDSPNSRDSHWVRAECAHARSLPGKKIFVLDSETDWITQLEDFMFRTRIYLSHSPLDAEAAAAILDRFAENDYDIVNEISVFPQNPVSVFDFPAWRRMKNRDRIFLALVTQNYLDDPRCMEELSCVPESCHRCAVVVVGDPVMSAQDSWHLNNVIHRFYTEALTEGTPDALLSFVETQLDEK